MSVLSASPSISDLSGSQTNNPDVLAMRRAFYEDGHISDQEAAKLFDIAGQMDDGNDDWAHFFAEALTDYVVHQAKPAGYVSEDNANWLIAQVERDGHVKAHCELAMLVKVLDSATSVPERLTIFTLNMVKDAVLAGNGRLLGNQHLQPGVLGKAEVALVRKAIFAVGGEGNITVSRAEADFLFDLNDAVADAPNHPSWQLLFRQGITNHLMAANNYTPMTQERAEQVEAWVDAPSEGVAGFFSKMLGATPSDEGQSQQDWYAEENKREATNVAASEKLDQDEVSWLKARIGRDGGLHANEVEVLRFIRDECPDIHTGLEDLLRKV